ncbi:MAG TPA: hypothetical protein PK059_07405 [Cyclobacteriaceae bacterium]|nr:hypothetical protein [Cyclobacteriaceae bacterium]
MSRILSLFMLVMTASFCTSAQISQPGRFEIDAKFTDNGVHLIPLREEGLVLVHQLNKFDKGKRKWQLQFLDTLLTEKWTKEIDLDNRLELVGFEHTAHQVYLLYREGSNVTHNFQMLIVDFANQAYTHHNIRFELTFRMTHFTVAGNTAIFGGYIVNEPVILLFDSSSDKPKVLPGLLMKDMSLLDVRVNQNHSFNVVLYERSKRDGRKLIVRTFDSDGNPLVEDEIIIDSRYAILTGITSSLEQDEMIVVGTYGEQGSKQALGIFSSVVDPFQEQAVHYTDFAALHHFLDPLKPRKQERIKAKAQLLRSQGKIPDYRTFLNPYRIEERPKGFYVMAEQYFSSSHGSPYSSPYATANPYVFNNPYSMYSYPVNRVYSPFYNDPYFSNSRHSDVRMVQTVVIELNEQGVITKDTSLKLDDIRQPSIDQVSDFALVRDSVVMMYKKESSIVHSEEAGEEGEKPTIHTTPIRLMSPQDILRNENEAEGALRHWYGHSFYLWGFQTIRNTTNTEEPTRRVYYINKVQVK